MKRGLVLTALAVLAISAVSLSCASSGDTSGIEVRMAPIQDVKVRIGESFPPLVIVNIRGGLPDGCSTFHKAEVSRSGSTIDIKVTIQRPRDAVCTQVYGTFERNVGLGSEFTPGVIYTINVNDTKTVTFSVK